MKNSLFVFLTSLMLLLFSCAGSSEPTTGEANDSSNVSTSNSPSGKNKLPDAVIRVKIKQGGSLIEEMNFTLKGQKATTQGATCSHQKATGIFALMLNGNLTGADSKLNISGKIDELKKQKFDIKTFDPQMRNLFCNYVNQAGEPFTSQSGSFEITKLDLYQDTGIAVATYFLDANFNVQLKSQADASQEVTIEGSVSGINTNVL